jgi:hypothetical protein
LSGNVTNCIFNQCAFDNGGCGSTDSNFSCTLDSRGRPVCGCEQGLVLLMDIRGPYCSPVNPCQNSTICGDTICENPSPGVSNCACPSGYRLFYFPFSFPVCLTDNYCTTSYACSADSICMYGAFSSYCQCRDPNLVYQTATNSCVTG